MAVVAHLTDAKGIPFGQYFIDIYRTVILGNGATDEWIATGRSNVIAAIPVVLGSVDPAGGPPHVELNAQGTGVAEGTNPGDIGIEVEDGVVNEVQVIAIVRP